MRHYPRNSPQAAGRILALALLSDGHLSKRELDMLDSLDAHTVLGLGRTELHTVVHGFCEDLLSSGQLTWADACPVDERTLADLMGEMEILPDLVEPVLQGSLTVNVELASQFPARSPIASAPLIPMGSTGVLSVGIFALEGNK